MPLVIPGYKFFWDEKMDYFFIKSDNKIFYVFVLYYFELEKANGGLEYLGKNYVIEEEWQVENFDYKPENTSYIENLEIDNIFILMDRYKKKDIFILKKLDIENLLFDNELTKIEEYSCYSGESLNALFNLKQDEKLKYFLIDENFDKTCKDFFISKSIDSKKLIEILGLKLFCSPVASNYFRFNYFNSELELNEEAIADYKLAIALQFVFVGIPLLPFSRLKSFNEEIISYLAKIIEIRKTNPLLKRGDMRCIWI